MINLKPTELPSKIIIQEAKKATYEAQKDTSNLALWSNGSKVESGGVGAAIVWKNLTSHW